MAGTQPRSRSCPTASAPLPLHLASERIRARRGRGSSNQVASGGPPDGADTWEGPHVTETIESTPDASKTAASSSKKKSGGLNSLLLADLKAMAGGLGIRGAGSMKKAQLVDAIKAVQSAGNGKSSAAATGDGKPDGSEKPERTEEAREQR